MAICLPGMASRVKRAPTSAMRSAPLVTTTKLMTTRIANTIRPTAKLPPIRAAVLIRRARKLYAGDALDVGLDNAVYALDSSTVDLCLSLFEWAPFRSTKAAIKLHTLLDLRGAIPAFIHISDGKLAPTERGTGVICDQRVMLNGYYSARKYPEHLRRIRFKDPESGKTLVFLTNNTTLPGLTIAALYKSRWQVELFFKWIKQHLRIKKFLGTSENAVKTQIWCAVSTYVLIAIIKKELHLDASLYTCLQILSVSVFEKTEISCALQADDSAFDLPTSANQLNLFEI
jgi:hypothetical protein